MDKKFYVEASATSVPAPADVADEQSFFETVPLPRNAFEDIEADDWATIAKDVYPDVKLSEMSDGTARWRVTLQRLGDPKPRDTSMYQRYRAAALLCMRIFKNMPMEMLGCMFGDDLSAEVAKSLSEEGAFTALPFEKLVEQYDDSGTDLNFELNEDSTSGTFNCTQSLRGGSRSADSEAPETSEARVLRRDWILSDDEFVKIPRGKERDFQWIDPVEEEVPTFTGSKFVTPLREYVQKYK